MADKLDVVVGVKVQADNSDIQRQINEKTKNAKVEVDAKLKDNAASNIRDELNGLLKIDPVQVEVKLDPISLKNVRRQVEQEFENIGSIDFSKILKTNITGKGFERQISSAITQPMQQVLKNINPAQFTIVDSLDDLTDQLTRITGDAQQAKAAIDALMKEGNFTPTGFSAKMGQVKRSYKGKNGKKQYYASAEEVLKSLTVTGNADGMEVSRNVQYDKQVGGYISTTAIKVEEQVAQASERVNTALTKYQNDLAKISNEINSLWSSAFDQKNPLTGSRDSIFSGLIDNLRDDLENAAGFTDNFDSTIAELKTRLSELKDIRKELLAQQDATNDLAVKSVAKRVSEKSGQIDGSMHGKAKQIADKLKSVGGTSESRSLWGSYGQLQRVLQETQKKGENASSGDWDKLTTAIHNFEEACRVAEQQYASLKNTIDAQTKQQELSAKVDRIVARKDNRVTEASNTQSLMSQNGLDSTIEAQTLNKRLKEYRDATAEVSTLKTEESIRNQETANIRLSEAIKACTTAINEKKNAEKAANVQAQAAEKAAKEQAQVQKEQKRVTDEYISARTKAQRLEKNLRDRGDNVSADRVKNVRESAEAQYKNVFTNASSNTDLESRKASVDAMKSSVQELSSAIKVGGTALGELNAKAKETEQAANVIKQAGEAMKNYATTLQKGENAVQSAQVFDIDTTELQAKIDALKAAQEALSSESSAANLTAYNSAMLEYETELDKVTAKLKTAKSAQDEQDTATHKAKNGLSEITRIRQKYTKALQDSNNAAKLANLEKDFMSGVPAKIKRATTQLQEFKKHISATGQASLSTTDQIKKNFNFVNTFMSGANMYSYVRSFLSESIKDTSEVNKSMVGLKKVTDGTAQQYDEFLEGAEQSAQKLSTTLTGLIDSTAQFGKLGYSLKDAASLGEISQMYSNVGDIDSAETAANYLISTMNGFHLAANDAMSIVDKFNIVENNFAITAQGLGEGLSRSAASLYTSNTSLEKSIALMTAANTVVQDESMVGNALKTLSARIRGASTELEALGEEQDEYSTSTSKLRGEIKSLTGVDIMIDNNTFKDMYDILKEISAVYENLTDTSKANVQEILFGKLRSNVGAAIMTNFDIAENAYNTAMNADGSATKEYEIWLESVEAKQKKMQASFESFSSSFMDEKLVGEGYDIASRVLNVLEKIVENLGSIPSLLTAIAGALSLSNNFGKMICPVSVETVAA